MRFDYESVVESESGARLEYFLVPWDTEIFGFSVAQIANLEVESRGAEEPLFNRFDAWCVDQGIRFSACRLAQSALLESEAVQDRGFRFVELNYRPFLDRLSSRDLPPADPEIRFVGAGDEDADELVDCAGRIFQYGRFHQDPLFDRDLANRRYSVWMRTAFSLNDQRVIRCARGEETVGFFVIEDPSPDESFWSLIGLAPEFQGGGWGTRVVRSMLRWHREEGKNRVGTSISSHNIAVMNLYAKLGWRFPEPLVSYHRHAPSG